MDKEKRFGIGILVGSVLLFVLMLGFIYWHYFHEHHADTTTGAAVSYARDYLDNVRADRY